MEEKKDKPKQLRLRMYNVVIHPAKMQSVEAYISLFDKIHTLARTYDTGTDKRTKLRSYSKAEDVIFGTLINYSTLDGENWYDSSSDEVVTHRIEPNIFPNAKEWDFYFLPEKHRMAVVVKRGVSWIQFEKYMNKAFLDAAESLGLDEVRFTNETSQEGIDEIFSLESIDSIEIEVSYSNNDTNDITAEFIDRELKKSNVNVYKTKATGTKLNPILLGNARSYLGSLVMLSKHNGFTKAIGKFNHRTKKINTNNYPSVETVKVTEQNKLSIIKNLIRTLF